MTVDWGKLAYVSDINATNVAAAGAVMEGDTTTAAMQFVIDEDTMVSDLATKVPTQQSVKAYVNANPAPAMTSYIGWVVAHDAPAPLIAQATALKVTWGDAVQICDGIENEIIINNCTVAWDTGQGANVICGVSSATPSPHGGAYATFHIEDAVGATSLLATDAISPAVDLSGYTTIKFYIRSDVALAAGDLQLRLDDTAACATPIESFDIPAILINTWKEVTVRITNPAAAGWNGVISVGLYMQVDIGHNNVWLSDIRQAYGDEIKIRTAMNYVGALVYPKHGEMTYDSFSGTCLFSVGTFICADRIKHPPYVTLKGAGMAATTFYFSGDTDGFYNSDASPIFAQCDIEDFGIITISTNTHTGFLYNGAGEVSISLVNMRNLKATNFGTPYYLLEPILGVMDNLTATRGAAGGSIGFVIGETGGTSMTCRSLYSRYYPIGYRIKKLAYSSFFNLASDLSTIAAYRLGAEEDGDASLQLNGLSFVSCGCEVGEGYGMWAKKCTGPINVIGGWYWTAMTGAGLDGIYLDGVVGANLVGVETLVNAGKVAVKTSNAGGTQAPNNIHIDNCPGTFSGAGITSITAPSGEFNTHLIKAPAAALDIQPTTDAVTAIQFNDKDGNAILNIDTTNNRVGIGTVAPEELLVLSGADASPYLAIENTQSASGRYPGFTIKNYAGATSGHPFAGFYVAAGTKAAPTVVSAGRCAGLFVFQAHNGTAFVDIARFGAYTGPNFAAGDQEGYLYFATGNGASYAERMRIQPTGTVGIGTTTPNANAILDLTSTTMAFMPPRMTTTERDAIASPTEGMVVFNITTHVLNYYGTAAWAAV